MPAAVGKRQLLKEEDERAKRERTRHGVYAKTHGVVFGRGQSTRRLCHWQLFNANYAQVLVFSDVFFFPRLNSPFLTSDSPSALSSTLFFALK